MIHSAGEFFTKGCGRCSRFDTEACATRLWAEGLAKLRDICRSAGLEETVKWGQPCYRHAGHNIAIIGAARDNFVLGFFHAGLMKDPEGILVKPGPNTRHADTIRFTHADQVTGLATTLRAYLHEAKGHAEHGRTAPTATATPDLPDELVQALDEDSALAEAFHALTPGRQRSHVLNLTSTGNPDTRRRRIAKVRGKILAGKGANEY